MLKIVSIRDVKADVFGNPVFTQSIGGAIRSFGDEIVKDDGNPLAMHPNDFELYHLGEFDPTNGEFRLLDSRVRIAHGSEFKKV